MAFSSTIQGKCYLGGAGGAQIYYGTWSGSAGDAAGTITYAGAIPYMVLFSKADTDNTSQIMPRWEASYSNGITTITVENQDNVTNGRFLIFELGD